MLSETADFEGRTIDVDSLVTELAGEQDARVLAWASEHEDVRVRRAAAANPNTAELVLASRLSNDPDVQVRMAVAANRNTSPHTLAHLCLDWHDNVAVAALLNQRTPQEARALVAVVVEDPSRRYVLNRDLFDTP